MQKYLLILIFVCGVILSSEPLFGQASSAPREQTIAMELYEAPDISSMTGYGNCQWLRPLDEPNETLLAQPEYKSEKLYYYAAKYGDADDNIYTVILDESKGTGTGYDTVYADLDNDNRINSDNEKFSFQMSTTSNDIPLRIKLMVSAGGKKIPYCFSFTAFPYTDENNPGNKVHANARNSSIFTGQANFDGKQYKIAIADLDSNGLFNDVEQGIFDGDRFFVDLDGDGKFKDSPSKPEEGFPYSQYTRINGKWYSVEATACGTTIQISPAKPQMGTVLAGENVVTADLHSDIQSQSLDFSEGSAEAIAGTYSLGAVGLSAVDANSKRTWQCRGRFRSNPPEIAVVPGAETHLDDVLPLRISIEPAGKSPSDVVGLKPTIAGANGGVFTCPRANQPEGQFEIQDRQGKVVDSGKFKYG
jgi:hypothetical protein